jgi:hypothetical protein
MKIYKYENYDHYKSKQTEANKIKIRNVWVSIDTIRSISDIHGKANKILCHGTRNAAEQKYFKKFYPEAFIVGTEISDTASNFEMTVEWDFHNEKDEWKGIFDIVYTNSLDHCIDPVKALTTWKNQLSGNGKLYLEYFFEARSREWDPFEANRTELQELLSTVGFKHEGMFSSKSNAGFKSETLILSNASI